MNTLFDHQNDANPNDLLSYYDQELNFIRELGVEFAKAHPKTAGRIKLDSHIACLVESFALLNARIRHKLDDEYPELLDCISSVICPHFRAPIPSMSVVQFIFAPDKLYEKYTIPKNTMLQAVTNEHEKCDFRTVYPVTLWPIRIKECSFQCRAVESFLRVILQCTVDEISFAELSPNSVRFFINLPYSYAYKLYELLCNNIVQIRLADAETLKDNILLANECLQQVGFAENESLLPYSRSTFMGYRLLTDNFILPEKFLFFDLNITDQAIWRKYGNKVALCFQFNVTNNDLEKQINIDSFILGCTPIVNLFEQYAEPIHLNHTKFEYQVVPDISRKCENIEVYSIEKVIGINAQGKSINFLPFYGYNHYSLDHDFFWHASRKPAWHGKHYNPHGTEVFLSLYNKNFNPLLDCCSIINASILATNRQLPAKLPFGENEPRFTLREHTSEKIKHIRCLIPPTMTYHPGLQENLNWQLISHLSQRHLYFTETHDGVNGFKKLLNLYNFSKSDYIQNMIDCIINLRTKNIKIRNNTNTCGIFWQGTEIILEIDESKFSGMGLYLFANVLEKFFALYTTINSFTQLSVCSKNGGELYKWSPRAGIQQLF